MREPEMKLLGKWIADITNEVCKGEDLPDDKDQRNAVLKKFKQDVKSNTLVLKTKAEVIELCRKFPLYPGMEILR